MPSSAWRKRLNSSFPSTSASVSCFKQTTALSSLRRLLGCLFPLLRVYAMRSLLFALLVFFFFFNDTASTEIYTLSLHGALPICIIRAGASWPEDDGKRCRIR